MKSDAPSVARAKKQLAATQRFFAREMRKLDRAFLRKKALEFVAKHK